MWVVLRVIADLVELGFDVAFPCVAVLRELLGVGFRCAKVVLCGHEADDIAGLEIQGLAEFGKRDEVHAAAIFYALNRLFADGALDATVTEFPLDVDFEVYGHDYIISFGISQPSGTGRYRS